ncbi:fluoride efflux transporter CrcB [Lentilactobacillus sp. Marseille-Q4993]|uniref:fluoride efflux transporter CrcB n=1 Tax=Lentilactobacillus sp. Marseille-Q4993 TaxID=3039492 RepID=UPI0024BD2336|nr:fluoride efflux transporter CrcB [Lentilactobacillus sp. Marseille-Q4993]
MNYLLAGLGAAVGAIARYDITKLINQHKMTGFPIATLVINIIGAFFLGLFTNLLTGSPNWSVFLGVGICGGFTTFSTMINECLGLLKEQKIRMVSWYLILTIGLGVGAATLGFLL